MILLSDAREIYANPDNNTVPERLRKFWPQYIEENDGIDSSPETVNLRMKVQAKYEELTGIMYAAGVPLLAGTDAPEPFTPPGLSLLQELELLVKSGLPPAAVLASATIQNAQSLREANQLGSIEEGKFADLVILDANPLADIRNTRKIYRVIRGGNISDPRELLKMVPTQ
jgi:imidazolonepropionase-like amidohydrolase